MKITCVLVSAFEEESSGPLLPHLTFLVQEIIKLSSKHFDLFIANFPTSRITFRFGEELAFPLGV